MSARSLFTRIGGAAVAAVIATSAFAATAGPAAAHAGAGDARSTTAVAFCPDSPRIPVRGTFATSYVEGGHHIDLYVVAYGLNIYIVPVDCDA